MTDLAHIIGWVVLWWVVGLTFVYAFAELVATLVGEEGFWKAGIPLGLVLYLAITGLVLVNI